MADETASATSPGTPETSGGVDLVVTLCLVAIGVRTGLMVVAYTNLLAVPVSLPPQPFIVMGIHLVGTIALAGVVVVRRRVPLGFGLAFLLYSTVTLLTSALSAMGTLMVSISSAVVFVGLVIAWVDPRRPARSRQVAELGVAAAAGALTFVAMS